MIPSLSRWCTHTDQQTGKTRWVSASIAVKSRFWPLVAVLAVGLAVPQAAHAQAQDSPSGDDADDEGLYSCDRARRPVLVSFKPEVELKDLITWAMGFTCRNFVYGAGIGGRSAKVTIMAPRRMSPQQAYRVFLVALQTLNLTVVPQGNVLRIVESAQAKKEPLPLYRRGNPAQTSQLVRLVVRPEHIPVDELSTALNELVSTHGKVTPLPKANLLVITDYGSTIGKMRTLISEIDQPLDGERLYLLKVEHADATELASKLQEIVGTKDQSRSSSSSGSSSRRDRDRNRNRNRKDNNRRNRSNPLSSAEEVDVAVPSKIIPDERTNALILLASNPAYVRVRALVKRLDIPIDVGGSGRIHVYPLEHGVAEEIGNTLTSAITGVSQSTGSGGRGNRQRPTPRPTGGSVGTPAFEGQVHITHDKPTNALVVVASVKDFLALKDVIEKLDVPRRQVFIEAIILEVRTDSGLDLGTSFHGGLVQDDGSLIVGGLQTDNLQSLFPQSLAAASGLAGGLIGPSLPDLPQLPGISLPSHGILFQALATSNNVNVLSSPHILTTDNEEAEISVGQNIPYQSGISSIAGGTTGGTTGGFFPPVQSVQRQDVALTLKITPYINASDMVRLEIDQEISDVASPDFGGLGPSWSKRTVKTTVVVSDQQSVVIGGLMGDRVTLTETKIPLLGDLPILGYLFKFSRSQKEKTNLLILLTPYVVKNQMDIEQIVERKRRESEEFIRTFSTFTAMKYRPDLDYRRKRGLIEQINRSALVVERDIEALREASENQNAFPEGPIEYTEEPAGDSGTGSDAGSGGGQSDSGAQGDSDARGDSGAAAGNRAAAKKARKQKRVAKGGKLRTKPNRK